MRSTLKHSYIFILYILMLAGCRDSQRTNVDRIAIITDSISTQRFNLTAHFYDSSFELQSVQLPLRGKVVFVNASAVNEICLENPSGRVWKFLAMGGDSIGISFVNHAPAIKVLNRKSLAWDQNFEWLKSKELGSDSSALEDYYYLAETINGQLLGPASEMLASELQLLFHKAERALSAERDLIDSLRTADKISSVASRYLMSQVEFKKMLLSEMTKGKLSFADSSMRSIWSVFIADRDRSGTARSHVFQKFLDSYVQHLLESDHDVLLLYDSITNLPIDRTALNLIKVKVATISFERLSEPDRVRLISLLNNDGLKKEAVRIKERYPVADIFGSELILLNQNGEKISADVLAIRHRGKKVYVDIWAGWCGPCISEIPALNELKRNHGLTTDIIYVSIDKSPQDWDRAIQNHFSRADEEHYYVDPDQQAKLAHQFGISSIPRYILLNESGEVIFSAAPRPHDPKINSILWSPLNN